MDQAAKMYPSPAGTAWVLPDFVCWVFLRNGNRDDSQEVPVPILEYRTNLLCHPECHSW